MTYSGSYYNKAQINCLFNDSLLMHKYVLFDYECKNNTTAKSYAIMFHYYTLYKCIIHNSFIHSFIDYC